MVKPGSDTLRNRPAETGGVAAAVVVLIAYGFGLDDPALLAALTIVVGAIPGIITWAVVMYRDSKS